MFLLNKNVHFFFLWLQILDLLQTSVYRGNKTPNKDRKPEKLRAQQKTTCKSAEMFLCGVGLEIKVGVY